MPLERKVATTEEMVVDIKRQQPNQLTRTTKDAPETVERRRQSIGTDIDVMQSAINGYSIRGQLPMRDTERVKEQILNYLDACKITGKPPIFMDICAALGRDRVSVYEWMRNNPKAETTQLLKLVQTQIAATLSSQALQRNISEVVSIFLLKNSGENVQLNDNYGVIAGHNETERETPEMIAAKYADLVELEDDYPT